MTGALTWRVRVGEALPSVVGVSHVLGLVNKGLLKLQLALCTKNENRCGQQNPSIAEIGGLPR